MVPDNATCITKVIIENVTVFRRLELEPCKGINILIGENGTGKTHFLKAVYGMFYSIWESVKTNGGKDAWKSDALTVLPDVFGIESLGSLELIRNRNKDVAAEMDLSIQKRKLSLIIKEKSPVEISDYPFPIPSANAPIFIPVKDILAHASGFRSLMSTRIMPFERVYKDILDLAFLPPMKKLPTGWSKISEDISNALDANRVGYDGERFFLETSQGTFDFMMVAEGWRKLALLVLLINNGALHPGVHLFWDEPDTNLNPKLLRVVAESLLAMQRLGVQIFLATHNYVLLKEFDLLTKPGDSVRYHALYQENEDEGVLVHSTDDYLDISPNAIADTFGDLYDRDMQRALSRG